MKCAIIRLLRLKYTGMAFALRYPEALFYLPVSAVHSDNRCRVIIKICACGAETVIHHLLFTDIIVIEYMLISAIWPLTVQCFLPMNLLKSLGLLLSSFADFESISFCARSTWKSLMLF